MGIVLIATTIYYGYRLKAEGAPWGKTILYSILVFSIIRAIALIFQIGPTVILGEEISDNIIFFSAIFIPTIIYAIGPNYIYKKRWLRYKTNED